MLLQSRMYVSLLALVDTVRLTVGQGIFNPLPPGTQLNPEVLERKEGRDWPPQRPSLTPV